MQGNKSFLGNEEVWQNSARISLINFTLETRMLCKDSASAYPKQQTSWPYSLESNLSACPFITNLVCVPKNKEHL